MKSSLPADLTVFYVFGAIGLMGVWDGLVRRHIRVRPGEWLPSLAVRGLAAIGIGATCLAFLLIIGHLEMSELSAAVAGCADPLCVLGRIVSPPFTSTGDTIILLALATVFLPWLKGMLDLDGPFRTRLLAPGIWYRERELLTVACKSLQEHKKSPVDANLILEIANDVLRLFHGISPTMSAPDVTASPPTIDMVVRSLTHSSLVRQRRGATEGEQRLILEAITPYIIAKLEAAERRWPWRRRFFATVP
jgi:hypothetical protein